MADIEHGGVEVFALADDATPATDAIETIDADASDGAESLPRQAQRQADGSIVLPLAWPVTLRYLTPGSQTPKEDYFGELHFRRLTGADMRKISSAQPDDRVAVLLACSTGIKIGLMQRLYDRMDATDVTAAINVAGFFTGTGQRTGR
jgi:hypothetical protein